MWGITGASRINLKHRFLSVSTTEYFFILFGLCLFLINGIQADDNQPQQDEAFNGDSEASTEFGECHVGGDIAAGRRDRLRNPL